MRSKRFLLCSVLVSATATAQVNPVLFGSYDCGQWVSSPGAPMKAWLLGYLSGINWAVATKSLDPLDKINSAEQVFLWMDNYCRANPLKKIHTGANELYRELEKR